MESGTQLPTTVEEEDEAQEDVSNIPGTMAAVTSDRSQRTPTPDRQEVPPPEGPSERLSFLQLGARNSAVLSSLIDEHRPSLVSRLGEADRLIEEHMGGFPRLGDDMPRRTSQSRASGRRNPSRSSSNGSPSEELRRQHPLVTWFDSEVRPELDAIQRKLDFLTCCSPSLSTPGGTFTTARRTRQKAQSQQISMPDSMCGRSISSESATGDPCAGYKRRNSQVESERTGLSLVLSCSPARIKTPLWGSEKMKLDEIVPERRRSSGKIEDELATSIQYSDDMPPRGGPTPSVGSRRASKLSEQSPPLSLPPQLLRPKIEEAIDAKRAQQQAVLMARRRSAFRSAGGHVAESVWDFLEDPDGSANARRFGVVQQTFFTASVVLTLLQTTTTPVISGLFAASLEVVADMIFLGEFLVRMITCPNHKAFFKSPYTWIDFLAALPLILRLHSGPVLPDSTLGLNWAHSLLFFVVPVIRVLKILRRFQKFHLLLKAFNLAAEALPVLLFILFAIALFFSVLIYMVEQENMESLPKAFWFTIVTMTTVGYGDISPATDAGLCLTSILIIITVLYMAIPLGIVGEAFAQTWQDRDRILLMQRTRERLHQWGYTAADIPILFRLSDENDDGDLSFHEFRQLLEAMHLGFGDERIMKLFASLDKSHCGTIDAKAFVRGLFPEAYHAIFSAEEEADVERRDSHVCLSLRRARSKLALEERDRSYLLDQMSAASCSLQSVALTPPSRSLDPDSKPVAPELPPVPGQAPQAAARNGHRQSTPLPREGRKRLSNLSNFGERPVLAQHRSCGELQNS